MKGTTRPWLSVAAFVLSPERDVDSHTAVIRVVIFCRLPPPSLPPSFPFTNPPVEKFPRLRLCYPKPGRHHQFVSKRKKGDTTKRATTETALNNKTGSIQRKKHEASLGEITRRCGSLAPECFFSFFSSFFFLFSEASFRVVAADPILFNFRQTPG